MSFIVRQHSFRSKNFILSNDFVQQTCLLLKNRDQHLRLVALKFLRTCIGLKDEDYNGHLIELDVFTNVMDLFLATHNRNNLVNSVCLEFFDFIMTENIHSLGTHIIATSGKRLENVRCMAVFSQLRSCFERPKDISSDCADEQRHEDTVGDETVLSLDIATNTRKEKCQNVVQNGLTAGASSLLDADREDLSTSSQRRRKFAEYESKEEQDVTDHSRFEPNAAVLERGEKRPRHSAPSPVDGSKEQTPEYLDSTGQAGRDVVAPSAHNEPGSATVSLEVPLPTPLCTPSALPIIAPRTGILFVKAGTDMKDKGESEHVDMSVSKAAMQLRSDLATESLKHQPKPLPTPPVQGTEKVGKRRKAEDEPVRGSKSLRMQAKRKGDDRETESHFRIQDLLPKGSKMVNESLNGSSFGADNNGGDRALEEVTVTVGEAIELPKDTGTPVANIGWH
ncbi:hypothetical protein EC968_004322 [Mortierella alpina]|nr:hypothetical protein EC968_004322 [Mortierella alpina]